MDAEPQDFNERLSQWIASQGFWFQLRHSMSGGGGWSIALFHMLRMGFRLLLVAIVAGIGVAIYLMKRLESEDFKAGLESRFAEALDARNAKFSSFNRTGGRAVIRRIGAEGGSSSFCQSLEATNVSFEMGLAAGLSGKWDAEVIDVGMLDLELKGGAPSAEAAESAAGLVFGAGGDFEVRGIDVGRARVSWGSRENWRADSPPSYGQIDNSVLSASRVGEGWRLVFKGGTFRQNWIQGYDIAELVLVLRPDGLEVESGHLTRGESRIDFRDVKVTGAEFPTFSGTLVLKRVPLQELLPDRFSELLMGTISTELELSGSSNSPDGIGMKGLVKLGGGDELVLRSRLPLLDALDSVDVFHGYERVGFTEGSFMLETGGGRLSVTGIDMEARDLMSMQGRLEVRYPTKAEVAADVGTQPGLEFQPFFPEEVDVKEGPGVSLKQAGKASLRSEDGDAEDETNQFFAEMAANRQQRREFEIRQQQTEAALRARQMLRFDGGVRLMIPGDAFERSRELRERFPIDQGSGRIGIDVPLRGTIAELTRAQAEEILRLGQIRD